MEKTLTIFDMDDTLFHTSAQVRVMVGDKVVRKLSSSQYNTYKLKAGESFDYSEFRSAELFAATSVPIVPIFLKAKRMLGAKKNGSRMIIITARPDLDDRDLFLDKFRHEGLDIDSVHVERAGNIVEGSTPERKKAIVVKYLINEDFGRVRMFDDAAKNLDEFLALQADFPDISFEAYLVCPKSGAATRYFNKA